VDRGDPDDASPEADAARFLRRRRIADRPLALALDLLSRAEDDKRHELVFVDYKSLGVRQLGSIYEGLLEYRLEPAGPKGRGIALVNDRKERKATGSYYTPDHIVKYIVEQAVGPVLREKFEAVRPALRRADEDRRAFDKKQEELKRQGLKPEPASKRDRIGEDVVRDLFSSRFAGLMLAADMMRRVGELSDVTGDYCAALQRKGPLL
jgi:hypothetical protein